MQTFKDSEGREWKVEVSIGTAKRIRDLLKVDLLALDQGDPPLAHRLATDVILLCDILYVVVKPQAEALDVSDEVFGASLGGTAIQNAVNALYAELESFFQNLGRLDLRDIIKKQQEIMAIGVGKIQKKIEAIDVNVLMKDLDKQMDLVINGKTSTNSPE